VGIKLSLQSQKENNAKGGLDEIILDISLPHPSDLFLNRSNLEF
jgi:hypothetical protein